MAPACSGASGYKVPALPDAGATGDDAGQPDLPITGIDSTQLAVTGVEPSSGPFSGGNSVVVRGSGFTAAAAVRIAGQLVQASDVKLDGKGRLLVVVPAGNPGAADVSVTQGKTTATLRHGYSYNALLVDPLKGSIAGGTLVELTVSGATFEAGVQVAFDGQPCTSLSVLTPKRVRCATPPHALGLVDVQASWPKARQPMLVAKAAFEYIETSDADRGGLSGGPFEGTLNVTVVDSVAGFVVPGALVLLGDDPTTRYKGLTNARGSITFSGTDLKGPLTVHVSLKCFERGSIVAFNAQNVTVFISPILDLACLKQQDISGSSGSGSGGHGQLGSLISGELVFAGPDEFQINPWDIVPKPLPGESRVAYVFTTQSTVDTRNPSPDVSGAMAKLDEATAHRGMHGYQYRIFARPAGLAVYALCGIERSTTGEFTPYAMGVARNVVTSPGNETTGIDIEMNITLDHELDVALSAVPKPTLTGPTDFRVRANLDLGGEGVIVRQVGSVSFDTMTRSSSAGLFRFLGQPAFVGPLVDASYVLTAGYYTNGKDTPYTSLRRYGVEPSSTPVIIDDLLGIPQAVAPLAGGDIPADRVLRFELAGPAPDFFVVELTGGDGNPAWQEILPGSARSVPLPDLSKIKGQSDVASGFITWSVEAVRVDNFDYDKFQYTYLSPRYWTHSAENVFTLHH
ncbi:MAG TPA: IPT/TIG domain-containing protein [Polyangiales bacterium]